MDLPLRFMLYPEFQAEFHTGWGPVPSLDRMQMKLLGTDVFAAHTTSNLPVPQRNHCCSTSCNMGSDTEGRVLLGGGYRKLFSHQLSDVEHLKSRPAN